MNYVFNRRDACTDDLLDLNSKEYLTCSQDLSAVFSMNSSESDDKVLEFCKLKCGSYIKDISNRLVKDCGFPSNVCFCLNISLARAFITTY